MMLFQDFAADRESDVLAAERRRGLRISQDRPVRVFEPNTARFVGGRTRDVSSTGLQITFEQDVDLQPGRVINIAVGCDEGGSPLANRRHLIPARVAWISFRSEEEFVAGVEFLTGITAGAGAA